MTVVNPDRLTNPIPGRTGWGDRAEGPFWQRGFRRPHNRLIPYCRLVQRAARPDCLLGHRVALIPLEVQTPPCRVTPGFPCGQRVTGPRRGWPWGEGRWCPVPRFR